MRDFHTCPPEPLRRFASALFRAVEADCEIAEEVARHLINANLSGHDSHGVIRIPQYFDQIAKGAILPGARPEVIRETSVTALIDAHSGLGHFATSFALDWALERAARHGLAAAAIRHANHIGRLGDYTERAGARGFVAILTVGVGGPGVGGMVLFGSRQRFLGANPWSIAVPAAGRPPMVFDGSSSAVAEGKVRLARSKGVPLPDGAIAHAQGRPSTNPEDFYQGGGLLPVGGSVAGHKGYGLAMATMLVGALAMIDDPDPLLWASTEVETADRRGRAGGVFLLLVDPRPFGEPAHYQSLVAEVLSAAKRAPCAPGVNEILIPGEPETRQRTCKLSRLLSWKSMRKEIPYALGSVQRAGIGLPVSLQRSMGLLRCEVPRRLEKVWARCRVHQEHRHSQGKPCPHSLCSSDRKGGTEDAIRKFLGLGKGKDRLILV